MSNPNLPGAYEALGLSPTATLAEIRAAWKQRVLSSHPDKTGNPDTAAEFRKVQTAFTFLVNSPFVNKPTPKPASKPTTDGARQFKPSMSGSRGIPPRKPRPAPRRANAKPFGNPGSGAAKPAASSGDGARSFVPSRSPPGPPKPPQYDNFTYGFGPAPPTPFPLASFLTTHNMNDAHIVPFGFGYAIKFPNGECKFFRFETGCFEDLHADLWFHVEHCIFSEVFGCSFGTKKGARVSVPWSSSPDGSAVPASQEQAEPSPRRAHACACPSTPEIERFHARLAEGPIMFYSP